MYILECGDGSLYTGSTLDLEWRVAAHQAGKGAKYTASRRPVRLVFAAQYSTLSEAMRREAEIKRWQRTKKLALVGAWPNPHLGEIEPGQMQSTG